MFDKCFPVHACGATSTALTACAAFRGEQVVQSLSVSRVCVMDMHVSHAEVHSEACGHPSLPNGLLVHEPWYVLCLLQLNDCEPSTLFHDFRSCIAVTASITGAYVSHDDRYAWMIASHFLVIRNSSEQLLSGLHNRSRRKARGGVATLAHLLDVIDHSTPDQLLQSNTSCRIVNSRW